MKKKEFIIYSSSKTLLNDDYQKLKIGSESKTETEERIASERDAMYKRMKASSLSKENFLVTGKLRNEEIAPIIVEGVSSSINSCIVSSNTTYDIIYKDGNIHIDTDLNGVKSEFDIRCISSKGMSLIKDKSMIENTSFKDYMFKKIHVGDIISSARMF
jgi:hypothetical protein